MTLEVSPLPGCIDDLTFYKLTDRIKSSGNLDYLCKMFNVSIHRADIEIGLGMSEPKFHTNPSNSCQDTSVVD